MITVIVDVKVKPKLLEEYIETALLLTKESRCRAGCISYVFNQSLEDATKFSLYEQWESEEHLNEHIKALIALFGAPKPGDMLPAKLINFYESAKPTSYRTLG
ncbi:putative quinol monooxygenase [Motilimonas pumila]|uniref:putative quinol monooxygenase n=1 Tax=Motilimonas pumila TaxID=2303987 RepID=UPI001314C46C|nr:putative quinol monooxygenase [Motilimonas pumila]